MVISNTALTLVEGKLGAAGFAVGRVYCADDPGSGSYTALVSVDRTALSRLDSTGGTCRAEVTVSARLYAAERAFYGAAEFSDLCESVQRSLYFGAGVLISRAELSELKKDMKLGRLTRTLTVTAVYDIGSGEEATA